MNEMNITLAKYIVDVTTNENTAIKATIDGVTVSVPLDSANRHYDEIQRQVAAGTLTIADAD